MKYRTQPDIPFDERDNYQQGRCNHPQREYRDYPAEPKRGDRAPYRCVVCGKEKVHLIR